VRDKKSGKVHYVVEKGTRVWIEIAVSSNCHLGLTVAFLEEGVQEKKKKKLRLL
jgi:hypothetical protein